MNGFQEESKSEFARNVKARFGTESGNQKEISNVICA